MNEFEEPGEKIEISILLIDEAVEKQQQQNLERLRKKRDNEAVKENLSRLKRAAQGSDNLMPKLVACAKAYCTLGEMVNTLKEVFGEYDEPKSF